MRGYMDDDDSDGKPDSHSGDSNQMGFAVTKRATWSPGAVSLAAVERVGCSGFCNQLHPPAQAQQLADAQFGALSLKALDHRSCSWSVSGPCTGRLLCDTAKGALRAAQLRSRPPRALLTGPRPPPRRPRAAPAEEDARLLELVSRFGPQNWTTIANHMGAGRNGKSCRLRWFNQLDPRVNKEPFTEDEVRPAALGMLLSP